MRSKHSLYKSSVLVSIPLLIVLALIWLLSSFYSQGVFSTCVMVVFVFALFSRLWASFATKRIQISFKASSKALFPGEKLKVDLLIKNNKLLPLPWLDLFMPLDKNLCLIPEETRVPDSSEVGYLATLGANTSKVGVESYGKMLWYEESSFPIFLEAKTRGIVPIKSWTINTGDGFGLSESVIPIQNEGVIAVYPRIIDVNISPFLKNLWNASSGSHGVMEDISVIKSTRDYQTTDSLKHINWRLLARGEDLKVNVYEDILPKSIHLIFDGESFSGVQPHKEEMEKVLSAIASVILELKKMKVRCYLSVCEGETTKAVTITPEMGIENALFSLSAYENYSLTFDSAGTGIVERESVLDTEAIIKSSLSVGRFFYFVYDSEEIKNDYLLEALGNTSLTIVSVIDNKKESKFETVSLERIIKEGKIG